MSSDNISNWKYQNTQRSRDMLAEYLTGTKGIADAGDIDRLIADNERRGYLNHAAKIGATFGSVADVLAMQLDGNTPIEDDGPSLAFVRDFVRSAVASNLADTALMTTGQAIIAAFTASGSTGDTVNILDAMIHASNNVADAIREHAASIDRLAAVVEKATDRPIRVETQY